MPARYSRTVPDLETIRRRLASHDPLEIQRVDQRQAAVALILRERAELEVLLIERARMDGDPWSGHMAFPGGRVDPQDADAKAAALRETREEVGVDLMQAEELGRLDDLEGNHGRLPPRIVVSAFVYLAAAPLVLDTNHEVEDAFWVPLRFFTDTGRHIEYQYPPSSESMRFPGILVGDPDRHVVWGLTYRFLEHFLRLAGEPIEDRWHLVGWKD